MVRAPLVALGHPLVVNQETVKEMSALCWLYWSGDLADLLYPDPVFRVEPISVTVFSS